MSPLADQTRRSLRESEVLNLFHLGLDNREVMLVESLLSSSPALRDRLAFGPPRPGRQADILLVNVDDEPAAARWDAVLRSSPYTRGILISNDQQPGNILRAVTVQRPLTLRKLEGALTELMDGVTRTSPDSGKSDKQPGNRLEILLVDDSLQAREFLKIKVEQMLAGTDVAISECADGQSAVKAAREKTFDLIFLDVEMPGMNGFETCEQIRKFSNARIAMLTGKSMADDFREGSRAGCNHYLVKPPNDQDVKVILTLTQLKKGKA